MSGIFARWRAQREREETSCSAVVVAAGSARRMEGVDKALAMLGEFPLLVHTLYALEDCQEIQEIVVVTREDLLLEVGELCRQYGLNKVSKVVTGGAERIHSVQAGLREVRPDAGLIAIHDGARPFVTREVVHQAVCPAAKTGAAAPAIPVVDTIKRGVDGVAVETLDRSMLWAIQTPQVFEAGLIRGAIQKALDEGICPTDDCGAVERLGMRVTLTPGSRENIKVTTPFDLMVGEAILQARGVGAR